MMELADMPDSKSGAFGRAGSTPAGGTLVGWRNGKRTGAERLLS